MYKISIACAGEILGLYKQTADYLQQANKLTSESPAA